MSREIANSVARTVNHPGAVPLHYQYSASRVIPVTLKYDDTGIRPTSALWVSRQPPPAGGDYQRDRAYYLQWAADQAYAIEISFDAQLFFTAELTGCGILIFSAPNKLIIVHHNVQVAALPLNFFQRTFMSAAAVNQRNAVNSGAVRDRTLTNLAQDILAASPEITGGTQMSVQRYGDRARIFGVKRGGRWRISVNRPVGGNYRTELLYG